MRPAISLTPDLVGLIPLPPGPAEPLPGLVPLTDDDVDRIAGEVLAAAPAGEDILVFAFGSLLWNPGVDHVAEARATAPGWHRAFRMKIPMHRGTPERPGLMMGLDRGGTCHGIALTVEGRDRLGQIRRLVRRELPGRFPGEGDPHAMRWIRITTADGPRAAIAWVINRASPIYTGPLDIAFSADILATAAGSGGSCAEYLMRTVETLAARGIRDRGLWQLQSLVATRLAAGQGPSAPPADAPPPGNTAKI